jgi:hypothetical protein
MQFRFAGLIGLGVRHSEFQRKTMSQLFISHLMRLKKFVNTKVSVCLVTASGLRRFQVRCAALNGRKICHLLKEVL